MNILDTDVAAKEKVKKSLNKGNLVLEEKTADFVQRVIAKHFLIEETSCKTQGLCN